MFHNIPLIKNFRFDFTNYNFIKAFTNSFFIVIFFSIPIYLQFFEINIKIVNTFFTIISTYLILTTNKKNYFYIGFLVGIVLFHWISFSFRYYDLAYLIPFMILFVGFVYGLVFLVFKYLKNIYLKALYFLLLEHLHPFGFNWFNPKLIAVESYISVQDIQYTLFVLSIATFVYIKSNLKHFATILLLLSFDYSNPNVVLPNLKIKLIHTKVLQDDKWDREKAHIQIEKNFELIKESIKNKNDIIIFPETAFAEYINLNQTMTERLNYYSNYITIVTGGLKAKNKTSFNSTYIFKNGSYTIIDKVILVPFGEKIPLPKFMVDFINDTFFNGASDYEVGDEFKYIEIGDYRFKNAICYEATSSEAFVDNPKYMIAISNNAWFTPSIEPTMQYLLLKYFSKKHNTVIFHSTNMEKTTIIEPK